MTDTQAKALCPPFTLIANGVCDAPWPLLFSFWTGVPKPCYQTLWCIAPTCEDFKSFLTGCSPSFLCDSYPCPCHHPVLPILSSLALYSKVFSEFPLERCCSRHLSLPAHAPRNVEPSPDIAFCIFSEYLMI